MLQSLTKKVRQTILSGCTYFCFSPSLLQICGLSYLSWTTLLGVSSYFKQVIRLYLSASLIILHEIYQLLFSPCRATHAAVKL